MPKPYQMLDLGYQRTPTSATLRVTMPDGTMWDVSLQVVVDSRDKHYQSEQEDTVGFIRNGGLSRFELYDWAGNNMNWEDLEPYAVLVPQEKVEIDYAKEWVEAEKDIFGNV